MPASGGLANQTAMGFLNKQMEIYMRENGLCSSDMEEESRLLNSQLI